MLLGEMLASNIEDVQLPESYFSGWLSTPSNIGGAFALCSLPKEPHSPNNGDVMRGQHDVGPCTHAPDLVWLQRSTEILGVVATEVAISRILTPLSGLVLWVRLSHITANFLSIPTLTLSLTTAQSCCYHLCFYALSSHAQGPDDVHPAL